MIIFTRNEMEYIQQELIALMTSQDEACVIRRESLDEQDIRDIQYFINSIKKVNVIEEENSYFIKVVYEHLGFWCFEDYTYNELLELLNDKEYCDLYKKLVLDLEE